MIRLALATAATLAVAAPAAAAQIVNVDGTANASLNGSNAVSVTLGAGTYTLTFTQGAYTAFTRFGSASGCDATGGNCVKGYENSARYIIGGTTYQFGDGAASGGIGPIAGGGYFDTAARSLAHAASYSTTFTLTQSEAVRFFLYDDNLGDNSGGVSLALAAVPEPATWAMFILGFGAIGGVMRRRRSPAVRYA